MIPFIGLGESSFITLFNQGEEFLIICISILVNLVFHSSDFVYLFPKELNVSLFMKSKCSKFLRKPRGIYEKSPRLTIPIKMRNR